MRGFEFVAILSNEEAGARWLQRDTGKLVRTALDARSRDA
jgi:hypothetical protein